MELNKRVNITKDIVYRKFDFLLDLGYKFESTKFVTSELVKNKLDIGFLNEKNGILIKIIYFPLDIKGENLDKLEILIRSTNDASKDIISFTYYLKKYAEEIKDYSFIISYNKEIGFKEACYVSFPVFCAS